jgi:hypothetical protein
MATGADASFITVDAEKLQQVWEELLSNPKFFETLYLDPQIAKKKPVPKNGIDPDTPDFGEGGKASIDQTPTSKRPEIAWSRGDAEGFINAVRPTDDALVSGKRDKLITYLTTEDAYAGKPWEDLYGQTSSLTNGKTYERLMRAHTWQMSKVGTPLDLNALKGWSTIQGHINKALRLQTQVPNDSSGSGEPVTPAITSTMYTLKDKITNESLLFDNNALFGKLKSPLSISNFIVSVNRNDAKSLVDTYSVDGLVHANEKLAGFVEEWQKFKVTLNTTGKPVKGTGIQIAQLLKSFFTGNAAGGSGDGNSGTPPSNGDDDDDSDDDDEPIGKIVEKRKEEERTAALSRMALWTRQLIETLDEMEEKQGLQFTDIHIESIAAKGAYVKTTKKVQELFKPKARRAAVLDVLNKDNALLVGMKNDPDFGLWVTELNLKGDA